VSRVKELFHPDGEDLIASRVNFDCHGRPDGNSPLNFTANEPVGPATVPREIKNGVIARIDDNRVVDFEIVIGL